MTPTTTKGGWHSISRAGNLVRKGNFLKEHANSACHPQCWAASQKGREYYASLVCEADTTKCVSLEESMQLRRV